MRRLFKVAPAPTRGPILFWVPGGMPLMLHVEAVIAAALRLRGVEVHAVICDGPFDACVRREVTDGVPLERWHELCSSCRKQTSNVLEDLDIPYSFIGDFVGVEDIDEFDLTARGVTWETLGELNYQGLQIGQNVRSAVIRYFQGAGFNGDERIVKEYARSGLTVARAAQNAMRRFKPDKVFMSHAIYVDWGPALQAAFAAGIPVVGWMASYLMGRFYLRHLERGSSDFHSMSDSAWDARAARDLSESELARLEKFTEDRYLKARSFDMKEFKSYRGDMNEFRTRYGLDAERPVWAVFCHINWDQVADYSPMLHGSFDEWVTHTVDTVSKHPEVQWLIKVHPAEKWDNPSSGTENLLSGRALPPHVHIIPADEDISPMDLYDVVDGGVTVYGTPGLELSLMGKPAILAGEAHYGRRGFTHDANTKREYEELLARAGDIGSLSDKRLALARRYGYSYFIERQIPLPPVTDPSSRWWSIQTHRLEDLRPGSDPFVDLICDRILDGRDFELTEDLVLRAAEDEAHV